MRLFLAVEETFKSFQIFTFRPHWPLFVDMSDHKAKRKTALGGKLGGKPHLLRVEARVTEV
jgi:hypothetical protein